MDSQSSIFSVSLAHAPEFNKKAEEYCREVFPGSPTFRAFHGAFLSPSLSSGGNEGVLISFHKAEQDHNRVELWGQSFKTGRLVFVTEDHCPPDQPLSFIRGVTAHRSTYARYLLDQNPLSIKKIGVTPASRPKHNPSRIKLVVNVLKTNYIYDPSQEKRDIEFTHRFEVRGHWRTIQGIGRSPENTPEFGRTWVTQHVRGPEDKPLIKKIRQFTHDAFAQAISSQCTR